MSCPISSARSVELPALLKIGKTSELGEHEEPILAVIESSEKRLTITDLDQAWLTYSTRRMQNGENCVTYSQR